MATRIYFAAGQGDDTLHIDVEEEAGEVFKALVKGNQMPFELTESPNGHKVWVNPATVAYWAEWPSGPA